MTNLANVIAQGDFSPALRRALADREREIGEITTKLLQARPDSLRSKLRNIRSFVATRMQDLRAVLNSDVGHGRAELAKHIDQITLTPTGDAYVASGTWNFVGRGSIDGAGARHGPNVCRFVSSGWPRHESEANLSGLDLRTFGRRLAMGGCRVARLAWIEDGDECVYGGDQAN